MGSTCFRIDMPTYANLYLQGRLKLDELVSRATRLSPDDRPNSAGAISEAIETYLDAP